MGFPAKLPSTIPLLQFNDVAIIVTANDSRARLRARAAPAHIAFSPDGALAFVGCESSDEVAVVDLARMMVIPLIPAGKQS